MTDENEPISPDEPALPDEPQIEPAPNDDNEPTVAQSGEAAEAGPASAAPLLPSGPSASPTPGGRLLAATSPGALADWKIGLAVLAAAILLFIPGLGSFGLWDPWEVHYGEVGRQMVERGDWISPWWGSHWSIPGKNPEGEFFFSKPVLLLWMMGIGTELFGFSDFAIRIGTALIAISGVVAAYFMGARIWSRRVGVLMAAALMTSPFYAMLGRQAQTDMPFVGLLTVAMCCLMLGAFARDRNEPVDRLSWNLFLGSIAALMIPQLHTVLMRQTAWSTNPAFNVVEKAFAWGPSQLLLYLLMMAVVYFTVVRSSSRTRGQLYLFLFYAFVGLATMAKGILGFALPGVIILGYLAVSRDWSFLMRAEIPRGILVALFVGFPWYGAMFARHGGIGGSFWDRFIIHDHFKRLSEGVHQIDTGSFEHFIKWLGYGLFPWGSFLPAVIARTLSPEPDNEQRDQQRARWMLLVWFGVAYALFTLSSTKFHHYIFPAVPPIAILAALFVDDLLEGRLSKRLHWPLLASAFALFAVIGFDLLADPQHLKNLFTYRYDRLWNAAEWNPGFRMAMGSFYALFAVALLMMAIPGRRKVVFAGTILLCLTALASAGWTLNGYMATISPSWSQAGLWDAYYAQCTPTDPPPGAHPMKRYCKEPAISYKLNWRGETYYTQNEIVPLADTEQVKYFVEHNDARCFYAIMERGRATAFRNDLPVGQRETVHEAYTGNNKFILLSANCKPAPAPGTQKKSAPAPAEASGGGVID